MALKLRLARGGRKKLAHYSIVVTDSRNARDGRFIEKVGTYSPSLPTDHERRVVLNAERIQHWVKQGATPSERVAIFLGKAGLAPMPTWNAKPKKSAPKAKAQERLREQEEKRVKAAEEAEAAKAAAAAAAATPAPAPAAEEPAAEAAPEAAAETPAAE